MLGVVDDIHAEKPVQADPASICVRATIGVGLYLFASLNRILEEGVFYEATSVSGCSEIGEESSLSVT